MKTLHIILLLVLTSFSFAQEKKNIETVIQKGHLQKVKAVAYHPSGEYLATGSADFSIKLWNVKSGKEIRSFNAHTGTVWSLEFSADGSRLLSASNDKTFKIFDVQTGELLSQGDFDENEVWEAKFLPGEQKVLVSDNRDGIGVYNLKESNLEYSYKKSHSSNIKKLHVSPDGKYIGNLVNYRKTQLIPLEFGLDTIDLEFDKSNSFEFSPDGKMIALGSTKLFAKVFNAQTGKEMFNLRANDEQRCDGCNMQIAFSPNSKMIATGTSRTKLVIWNTSNGKKIKDLGELKDRPSYLKFGPNSSYLLTSDHKFVRVFDAKSGKLKLEIENEFLSYFEPKFSPDGQSILIPDQFNTASSWSISSGKKLKTYKGYLNTARTDGLKYSYANWTEVAIMNYLKNKTEVVISPNGKYLAQGKIDTIAQIVETNSGRVVHQLIGHGQQVISLAFSPNNKLLATGSGDRRIHLWDVQSGELLKVLKGHTALVFDLKFNKEGTKLISGSWDGSIRTWDVNTGKEIGYKDLGNNSAYEVAFSSNELYWVCGQLGKELVLVEEDSKEIFMEYKGHTKAITSINIDPESKFLVSGSYDGSVKVWQESTGYLINKIHHPGAVLAVACHPSTDLIFSGGIGRDIIVSNMNSGKQIATIEGHSSAVSSIEVCESAGILVSTSIDGIVKVWDLSTYKELYTYITINRNDWLVKNESGYFDGTKKALGLINYVSGMEAVSVSSFFKKYHTPGLQKRIMNGENFNDTGDNIHDLIKSASSVVATFKDYQNHLTTAQNDSVYKYSSDHISMRISAVAKENKAKSIRIYNNGKLILDQPFEQEVNFRGGNKSEREFNLELAPGKNNLEIIAINENGVESSPEHFTLLYDAEAGKTDLFILTLGVNEYQNPKYKLNYAKNDARSFLKTVKSGASGIFHETYAYVLEDDEVNKENVKKKFEEITSKIGPEDVFVLYYAGHGVMTESPSEFYLVTHNVTNLFGDDQMLKDKAISAKELMNYSREISAQKQLFVIDACQSGGALTAFATRGAPREKALAQLARSTGTFFLTASQDAQYANEVGDLKHGLFTYAILEVLTGESPESSLDEKITVNEIKTYVENRVPELTKKYQGSEQYPTSYSFGQDFPLSILKK